MTVALAVLAAGSLLLLFLQGRSHDRERDKWTVERSVLLDRIQAPHRLPVERSEVEPFEPPEDLGELAKVGMIEYDDGENGDGEG